jgi:hypothetical protein
MLRETIRAEVHAYFFDHPMGSQLIIREGVMDYINAALEKGAEFGRAVASKFSEGWEALSAGIKKVLAEVPAEALEGLKSGIPQLMQLADAVNERASDEMKNSIRQAIPELAAIEQELMQLRQAAQPTDLELKTSSETGLDVIDKARELQQEGARARRRFVMIESELAALDLRLKILNENRNVSKRGRLNEVLESILAGFKLFITVVGFAGLLFQFLSKLFGLFENKTMQSWSQGCAKMYDKIHHAEAWMIDKILPDRIVVELYNFWIFIGGEPVEGDVGRIEPGLYKWDPSDPSHPLNPPDERVAPAYEKNKITGKMGSSRQMMASDIFVPKEEDEAELPEEQRMPEEEKARRNKLRENIEQRIWMCCLLILLVDACKELLKRGHDLFYEFKGATKFSEILKHVVTSARGAAPEIAAASGEAEMLAASAAGAAAGAYAASSKREK